MVPHRTRFRPAQGRTTAPDADWARPARASAAVGAAVSHQPGDQNDAERHCVKNQATTTPAVRLHPEA